MPLPEILKQRLIENAQAVADKKVMVLMETTTETFDLYVHLYISTRLVSFIFSFLSSLLIPLSPKSLMSIVTVLLKPTQPQQGKEAPCLSTMILPWNAL